MISFPFKSTAPLSSSSLHDHPFSCKLGRNQCLSVIEECALTMNIGERAHFDVKPKHKDFVRMIEKNKWNLTQKEIDDNSENDL